MIKKLSLTIVLLLPAIAVVAAVAAEPQTMIRQQVGEVVELLKSTDTGDAGQREDVDRQLREIIREMFDYAQVARLALGRNWRLFSPDQKKAFANTFADFLGTIYINRIRGDFSDLSVKFTGSEMLTDTKAVVRSIIRRESVSIPVDYYLLNSGKGWRVYNVKIEGVSMVSNYRSQFNKLLLKESPDALILRLEKRLHKMRSQDSGAA